MTLCKFVEHTKLRIVPYPSNDEIKPFTLKATLTIICRTNFQYCFLSKLDFRWLYTAIDEDFTKSRYSRWLCSCWTLITCFNRILLCMQMTIDSQSFTRNNRSWSCSCILEDQDRLIVTRLRPTLEDLSKNKTEWVYETFASRSYDKLNGW